MRILLKRFSQLCVRSTTHRRAFFLALRFISCASSPLGLTWSVKPNSFASSCISSPTYPASRQRFCFFFFVGRGLLTSISSTVSRASFTSWRLAPSTAMLRGIPSASVSTLRLVPLLARSTGLLPVFFSAERGFCHCPIHRKP